MLCPLQGLYQASCFGRCTLFSDALSGVGDRTYATSDRLSLVMAGASLQNLQRNQPPSIRMMPEVARVYKTLSSRLQSLKSGYSPKYETHPLRIILDGSAIGCPYAQLAFPLSCCGSTLSVSLLRQSESPGTNDWTDGWVIYLVS